MFHRSTGLQFPRTCLSKSMVRMSRRAMSPSSMLESAMICDQEAPLAHASTRPEGQGGGAAARASWLEPAVLARDCQLQV